MASSTATLRHTILVIAFIAGATAQQQQGGVSWETAPECPDSGSGTAVDTEGRSWGWYNGQSCKHSRSPPQNAALTAAQQQQQSWDAAPPCKYQLTADNGRADAQGRLWGWQDGRSCRHTGSISSSPPITPSSPSPPPSPALAWEAAPPCSYQATVANSRVDALGRYWGWQTGVGSCRFDQPPKVTPPPSPSPPAASPDPASPAPLRAPVPPSPVPTKQQPVPTVPGKTVGTSPAPGEEVIPVPAVEDAPAVVEVIPTAGMSSRPEAQLQVAASPRPQVATTQPQLQPLEPEPADTAESLAAPTAAAASPRPNATVVLSSDLQKPSTTLTPSLKPATLSPSPLPGPPPSPSPTPDDSSEEGLVTIIPGVDLPDSSPAVAAEAGPKADGAAAAAAATAAAAAAVAAVNSTGVIDSVNVTALPVAAEVPVTSAPRATEQQQQQHQDATQLVLGYQGVPLSEFNIQYAPGSLAAVSAVSGVPQSAITQTVAAAPGTGDAAAGTPDAQPQAATPAATPAPAPAAPAAGSGAAPAVATESGSKAAATNAAAAPAAPEQQQSLQGGAVPAQTPAASAAGPATPTATEPAASAAATGRKLLRAARLLQKQQQQQQQQQVPAQVLLGGVTLQLRRLQGIGDNTYATYVITSSVPARTARSVTTAAKDGSLYQTLERNGVPLRPSVSLNGNMLQPGQPGVFSSKGSGKRLGTGAIAGIVIGAIAGVALLAALALLCCICCKRKQKTTSARKDSTKAAAVAKAKANLAKSNSSGIAAGKKQQSSGGSSPLLPAAAAAPSSPPRAQQQAANGTSPPVGKPQNLMDRFASWGSPQEAKLAPSASSSGTAPPAAAAGAAGKPCSTAAAAAAAAGAAAAAAAAAGAAKKGGSSSPGKASGKARGAGQSDTGDAYDPDAYHNSINYSRLSNSASKGAAAAGSAAAAAAPGDEGFLDGVPDLAAKSSLSKDVQKERGLTTNKLGIAGNPKFVTGNSSSSSKKGSPPENIPRPMSIRERVERDKQLEAAESGAVPSDLLSGVTDPSDSSYAPSGVTFNSMEPMEKSELAAAAMALQTRQRSAASTPRGTPVAGASHIQQIHLTGNRSPLTAQSPRHSIHSGRSPHGSPLQGPSPRASPRPGQSPRAGATASVAVVTPGVAGSIPCSTTASVSGKSVVEAPVGPPVNTGTSVGGSGWMWGNVRKPGSVYTTAPNPDPGASWDD